MKNKAFTLIEIMIVLTSLALLTALAITFYKDTNLKYKSAKIGKLIKDTVDGVQKYKNDTGEIPTDLKALFDKDSNCNTSQRKPSYWNGPYVSGYTKSLVNNEGNKVLTSHCTAQPFDNSNPYNHNGNFYDLDFNLIAGIEIVKIDNRLNYALVIKNKGADSDITLKDFNILTNGNNTPSDFSSLMTFEQIIILNRLEKNIDNSPLPGNDSNEDVTTKSYTSGKLITIGNILDEFGNEITDNTTNGKHPQTGRNAISVIILNKL